MPRSREVAGELIHGSMCINAGVSTALPSTDYEGQPRTNGPGPDIGPYET